MPILRNRLSNARAGGPRQYAELRDRLMIAVERDSGDVISELDNLNFEVEELNNAPVLIANPRGAIEDTLENLAERIGQENQVEQAVTEISGAIERGRDIIDVSVAQLETTRRLLEFITAIPGVRLAEFVTTQADFGPENLRVNPFEMRTLTEQEAQDEQDTLKNITDRLELPDAWNITRGENAVVAIFDTGYSRDLIDRSRIVGTFHGDTVDSAFASAEGHGTMCAGASAANADEGVPFNGTAPDAGVILVRTTDENGQIRSDTISKAWDWIAGLNLDRPIVTNHSYGTPICSGRPRSSFCNTPQNEVIKIVNSNANVLSCYAAGNEANYCGHRPSGITNAITGTNSLAEVITVGALLSNGAEAQRYSSHGRGDCSPVSDPKPNVSCAIPMKTYYGAENGWEIKDMSTGIFGSSGGTSHASPLTCGMLALIQSAAVEHQGGPLQTEEMKRLIEQNSTPPHRTQINTFGFLLSQEGYDARFGFGQLDINNALDQVIA